MKIHLTIITIISSILVMFLFATIVNMSNMKDIDMTINVFSILEGLLCFFIVNMIWWEK